MESANARQRAVAAAISWNQMESRDGASRESNARVDEYFGQDVFSQRIMRQRLSKETFKRLMRTIVHAEPLANQVRSVPSPSAGRHPNNIARSQRADPNRGPSPLPISAGVAHQRRSRCAGRSRSEATRAASTKDRRPLRRADRLSRKRWTAPFGLRRVEATGAAPSSARPRHLR